MKETGLSLQEGFTEDDTAIQQELEAFDENNTNLRPEGAFGTYLVNIAKHPLLTPERERELFSIYKDSTRPEEERKAAMSELIEANLRLVVHVAKQYAVRGGCMDRMDVIQEGNLGLVRAIELFDPEMGYRFSTYAYSWIHQFIRRGLTKHMNSVRIPDHMYQKVLRVKKRHQEWTIAHGGSAPDMETLAELSNLSVDETQYALSLIPVVTAVSLQMEIGEDDDTELVEFLEDPDEVSVEDIVMRGSFRKVVDQILESNPHISERDRDIFAMRMGWNDDTPMTLEEVGKAFGITRERVRQIEAKVMRILRSPKNIQKLDAYRE
jgi:RNA polymerase primary sigma factor